MGTHQSRYQKYTFINLKKVNRSDIDSLLNSNYYFIMSSNCEVTIGASRSLITDFQRSKLFSISNTYGKLLQWMDRKLIKDVLSMIEDQDAENFCDFLTFMLSEELGFITESVDLFPQMSKIWKSPSKITNAIFDFDNLYYDYKKAILELDFLDCKNLQLRFYKRVENAILIDILDQINKCNMTFVEIYCPFAENTSLEFYKDLVYKYSFLSYFFIFNSPEDKEEQFIISDQKYHPINFGTVYFINQNIKSEKGCGIIDENNMNFNSWELYSENMNYNGCLNKKISINKEGEIKNCPSFKKSYGNINTTSLIDVIEQPDFYRLFNITKDQIHICKDCEYRSNCTDCRAYLNDPSDIYSKPLKCGYNPYTNVWEEWSSNILKKKVINLYNFDTV